MISTLFLILGIQAVNAGVETFQKLWPFYLGMLILDGLTLLLGMKLGSKSK